MRKYRDIILIIVTFLCMFGFIIYEMNQAKYYSYIDEEATPIREDGVITGMLYEIRLGERVDDSSLTISSHILDSIAHYKDTSTIDKFKVELRIDNQSEYSYLLKNIQVIDQDTNQFIQNISYSKNGNSNSFVFQLKRDFFETYKSPYRIRIELEK